MFEPGALLYFEPFYFPDGKTAAKNKYMLVLKNMGEQVVLASLPTSKDHIPSDMPIKGGCYEDVSRDLNAYVFLGGDIVTDNGFAFMVNTFVYGQNLHDYPIAIFNEQIDNLMTSISIVGVLEKRLFDDVVNCLANSSQVKRKYKRLLRE